MNPTKNKSNTKILGEYFAPIYSGIFRIRMLIEMHSCVAKVSDQLVNQNFWGCLQNNIIISAVLIELFSILENFPEKHDKGKCISNKLQKNILKVLDKVQRSKLTNLFSRLNNQVKDYKKIRNELAHKNINSYHGPVDYEVVLALLNEFENALNNIICSGYEDYYMLSTDKALDTVDLGLIGPTIIKRDNTYYYCYGKNHCFITLENPWLYDKLTFPNNGEIKKISLPLLPKEVLIDINKVRLNDSYIRPPTKPNIKNFPAINELNSILNLEIGAK